MTDLSMLYNGSLQANFLHSQYYVEGCLLGACACPEIPLPDVWLPWVIKQHNQIQNAQQADKITDLLFLYFKHCLAQMQNDSLHIPLYASYTQNQHYALSQWCEGLLIAHSARESYWQGAWNKMQKQVPEKAPELAKNLKHCLMMFTTFADPTKAIEQAAQKGDMELANNLPLIAKSLPQTLSTYIAISGALAAYLPNQFETFTEDKKS